LFVQENGIKNSEMNGPEGQFKAGMLHDVQCRLPTLRREMLDPPFSSQGKYEDQKGKRNPNSVGGRRD